MTEREAAWTPTDEDWHRLVDDKELSKRRASAEKRFSNLTNDQVSFIRKRAKNDLFFLCTGMLEYELLTEGFHGHYCKWLQDNWGELYRMTLQARGHYKSTVNTICDSVQIALPNDANVQHRPYSLGPDVKLLLAHENRESASRFLFEITEAFTAKAAILAFFPECIPSRRVQRVNKFELELPRSPRPKEPTFDTLGAGGASQGRHFNWLKLDDLIGEDARDSETVMKRVLNWFDNINALLTRPKFDGWDLTGTHWANNDVYAHAIKMYGVAKSKSFIKNYFKKDIDRMRDGSLCVYGRAIEEKDEEGNIVIPFVEEFPPEYIARLKLNPKVYAAQFANNPKDSSLVEFPAAWQKFYNIGHAGRLYVFAGDKSWSVDQKQLDVCILIDPSVGEKDTSDESGFVVTGTDKQMNIYILEAFKKRVKPPELIDEMFRLYTKWWPRLISIESVAFSAMLKYWFDQKCESLRIYPNIYDYKPGTKRSKIGRIRGLGNYFAAGQVYMLEGMTQLRDEMEWFPLSDSEHILDALSQGPEVWAPGLDENTNQDNTEALEAVMAERDIVTGY